MNSAPSSAPSGGPPSRRRLFLPFVGAGVLLAAYTIYWFIAAGRIEDEARAWIAGQEAAGYRIEHGGMRVGGWPFRLSLRVDAPDIAAPEGEGGWRARMDALAASALPYDLNHWILAFDGPAELTSPNGTHVLDANDARLSVRSGTAGISHVGAELAGLVVNTREGDPAPLTRLGRMTLSGELAEDDRLDVKLELSEASLDPEALPESLAEAFGPFAERIRLDAALSDWAMLAATVDPYAWTETGGRADIRASQVLWGPARLEGSGEIGLDSQRRPQGRLSLRIFETEALVEALTGAGLISSDEATMLNAAARFAAQEDGGVALPFRLEDGGVFLGPVRVGEVGPVD